MAGTCSCDIVLGNTGLSKCPSIPDVTKKIILVPYFDASGNINTLDLTDPNAPTYGGVTGTGLNQAFFSDIVNATEKQERFYPLPNVKNVSDVRDTPTFESFDDGSQEFIKEGVGTFTAVITNRSPKFLGQLQAARCTPLGAYLVDKCNNIIGYGSEKDKLQPIKIDEATWAPQYVKALDTAVAKISLSFQWAEEVNDAKLCMVDASDISASLLSLTGLLDVNVCELVANTATELKVDLQTVFGNPVEGLTVTELTVFNQTTGLAVVPTAVAEAPAGCYTITIPAQTAGDLLNVVVSKTGLDGSVSESITVVAL